MSAARHLRPPQLVATSTLKSSTGRNLPTNGPIRAIQSLASIFIQMWLQMNHFCQPRMPIQLKVVLAALQCRIAHCQIQAVNLWHLCSRFSPSKGPNSTMKASAGMYIQLRDHCNHWNDYTIQNKPKLQNKSTLQNRHILHNKLSTLQNKLSHYKTN